MTRATFLKLLGAAALGVTASACSTRSLDDTEDETAENSDTSYGEVIDTDQPETDAEEDTEDIPYGLAYMPDGGVHPYVSTNVTNLPVQSLLYEELFIVNRYYEPEPVLCRSYHYSEDKKTWYFEIYHDVHFSDGSLLTADDVVSSWDYAENQSGLYDARFRFILSYSAEDDYNITVKLGLACDNLCTILDLPVVKADTLSNQIPVGTGPYTISGLKLVRNTYWWQKDRTAPGIDSDAISLISLDNIQDIRDEFQFGDVDVVYTDPYTSSLPAFQGDNEPWGINTTEMQYLAYNLYETYCSSAAVRASFTHIINRAGIISDIYGGAGLAATLPCNPAASIYDTALAADYSYDLQKFVDEFAASGFKPNPGNPMRFVCCSTNSRRVQAAQMIVDALNSCNFYTELFTYKKSDFLYIIGSGQFDVLLSEVKLPPNFDLACFFGHNRYTSVGGISSDTNKSYMNAAIENSGNYYDLWRSIMNRGIICPIMFKVNTLYTTRGTLKNTYPSISNLLQGNGVRELDEIFGLPGDITDIDAAYEEDTE